MSSVPIAIVGIAFEFPQDTNTDDKFWRLIAEGQCTSTEFPPNRLNIHGYYHPGKDRPSTIPLRGGHFLTKPLGAFDAPFFSISPAEASCMDPQHRHMLETTYHALEDAGLSLAQTSGSQTCVYTGCFTNDYLSLLQQDYQAEQQHAAMGIAPSMLANRLSWFFNFKGTSMNIDSACSSSLLALHLACQELQTGTATMGVVGGANLVYHPNFMKMMSDFNFLSPDSRSWSFDARANGYARGDGIAVIVVKRLDDALRDGNTIRGVIRGTHSNQDGRTPGITQPSSSAQVDLIKQVYSRAQLDMAPTRFFEAHGTGTPVGDPIEANAMGQAFAHCRTRNDPLFVGAIKANIGHLEGCSGLAGVIKAVLVLEKAVIPPIAGFSRLNERIDADQLALVFPKVAQAWPTSGLRRACINSFGFGGSNAVAVIDDAYNFLRDHQLPKLQQTSLLQHNERPISSWPVLLVWSAHDKDATQALSTAYHEYLSHDKDRDLYDLAYTLCARRSHFTWRSFTVIRGGGAEPERHDPTRHAPVKAQTHACLAFVFTGQGAQYAGMGSELLSMPVFATAIDQLQQCLKELGCQWSLRDALAALPSIDEPSLSQPVTTCLQIALVDVLQHVGLAPAVVVGHSSGEIAAAYACGGLSRSSAVKVAYHRGLLASQLARSTSSMSMMAVGLSADGVRQYLGSDQPDVSIGCINSPQSLTLTGLSTQLAQLEQKFNANGIFARMLRVPLAYHSRFMQAVASSYKAAICQLEADGTRGMTPMLSTVTTGFVTPRQLVSPEYWISNMTQTVKFGPAIERLVSPRPRNGHGQLGAPTLQHVVTDLLEIGPHSTLKGPIQECIPAGNIAAYESCMARGRQTSSVAHFLQTLGKLYSSGNPVTLLAANSLLLEQQQQQQHNTWRVAAAPAATAMPRYPFNHTISYWKESRLSRNVRFQQVARHDLLGTRATDWNPQVAQWRNVMRLDELEWLRDHQIDGVAYMPGAAMIMMAVQALLQLLNTPPSPAPAQADQQIVRGVRIKDVCFSHAIKLARQEGTLETQLTMIETDSSWSLFRLCVFEEDRYVESCHGYIRADTAQAGATQETGSAYSAWLQRIRNDCKEPASSPYDMQTGTTIHYGPAFRCVSNMRLGAPAKAVAEVRVWPPESSKLYMLHPSTLDGLAQLLLPAVTQGGKAQLPTMVPTFISRVWISSEASQSAGQILDAATECSLRGTRGIVANVAAFGRGQEGGGSAEPVVALEGLETTLLGSSGDDDNVSAAQCRRLCTKLLWKPDIELLSAQQLFEWCTADRPHDRQHGRDQFERQSLCIMAFILEALDSLDNVADADAAAAAAAGTAPALPPHQQHYVEWMKHQRSLLQAGKLIVSEAQVMALLADAAAREHAASETEASGGVQGRFFMHLGRKLVDVLHGRVLALDLMFKDSLADEYYESMLADAHLSHPISAYLDLACFKKPNMKLLEIGAGTGGQTVRVLEAMTSHQTLKWERYDYTDVSPAFLGQARSKFRAYAHKMTFQCLDISRDVAKQSFEPHTYDIVIASHVLHATNRLQESLRYVHQLLKPGGKLVLVEMTRPEALHMGFAFGLLEGWWDALGNESRSLLSPCLDTAAWGRTLKAAGFSGVDIEFWGQADAEIRYSSIIISSAADNTAAAAAAAETGDSEGIGDGLAKARNSGGNVVEHDVTAAVGFNDNVCHDDRVLNLDTSSSNTSNDDGTSIGNRDSNAGSNSDTSDTSTNDSSEIPSLTIILDREVQLQGQMAALLQSRFPRSVVESLSQAARQPGQQSTVVFLLDVDALFFDNLSRQSYAQLQSILVPCKQTLWVSAAAAATLRLPPQHHIVDGLSRTLASEDSNRKFATLSIHGAHSLQRQADAIAALLLRLRSSAVNALEMHHRLERGLLSICRVSCDADMDAELASRLYDRPRTSSADGIDESSILSLKVASHGKSVAVQCYQAPASTQALGPDEIEIAVKALNLDQHDLFAASGHSSHAELGTHGAGIVKAAGSKKAFEPGQAVVFIGQAVASSFIRLKGCAASSKPPQLSFTEAATIPMTLCLAYQALVNIARLRQGESVVVYGATGSTGLMALGLGRWLGARMLALCQSEMERSLLITKYGFDNTTAFSTGQVSYVKDILARTDGNGADVLLCASDVTDALHLVDFLSPHGRLIDLCPHGGSSEPQSVQLGMNRLAASIDMVEMLRSNPSLVYDTFQAALSLPFVQSMGALNQQLQVFGHDDVARAFTYAQNSSRTFSEATVLEWRKEASCQVLKSPWTFSTDASYLICGGLGGLGQSIAKWMVSRGARHLILVSRSGPRSATAKALVHELKRQGVDLATPSCDMANEVHLGQLLHHLASSMPPIKGCIQAAVALKDSLFHNMTFDDWSTSTDAKVAASWNLHRLLPDNLDFFIQLSSLNGIFGRGGQANYAAGNTFKDALAHHRIAHGQKAVAIDLGLMLGEGVVAQNEALLSSLRKLGHLMDLYPHELNALLDYYCDPELRLLQDHDAQVLVGIEMPHNLLAKGLDLHRSIRRPIFSHLFQAAHESTIHTALPGSVAQAASKAALLKNADSPAALIQNWLCQKLALMLDISPDDMDPSLPMHTFGIDSLVAIDVNNWLDHDVGAQISVLELMANVSITSLAALAAERSRFR